MKDNIELEIKEVKERNVNVYLEIATGQRREKKLHKRYAGIQGPNVEKKVLNKENSQIYNRNKVNKTNKKNSRLK